MDCRQFERLLWEKPNECINRDALSGEMRRHLNDCPDCQKAYHLFCQVVGLNKKSEVARDYDYWQKFESQVFARIDRIETAEQPKPSRSYRIPAFRASEVKFKHLVLSLGIATAVVLFMFVAISDVTRQVVLPDEGQLAFESKKRGKAPAPLSQNVPRSFKVNLGNGVDGSIQLQEFSILPEPEVEVIDESTLVAIDAAYLTDKGIKQENFRASRALSEDIVVGSVKADTITGRYEAEMVDSIEPDWVISFEKMPTMKKAVTPTYPALAYQLKKSGEVWIKARIDSKGKVVQAIVYRDSGTDYGFEEAALQAAYNNEFEPLEIDNRRIPVWVIYKVRFVMKE
jgi:TonB family protein